MNIVFLMLLNLLVTTSSPRLQEEYVCTPCGYSCDHAVHNSPGTCSSCNMVLVKKSTVRFKDINVEEFCKRISENKDVLILDVRSPEEFTGNTSTESYGHFKNAININITELEARVKELAKYKNKEVLVYCSHSHRSPRASYLLNTNGFTNVKNLAGGVSTFTNTDGAYLSGKFVSH